MSKAIDKPFATAIGDWCQGRMSSRPDYYSGRGPNRGDLCEVELEMICQGIREEHGDAAGERFVDFVESLSDMSATAFLVSFRRFYESGFETIPQQQGDEWRAIEERGDRRNDAAMFMILAAMTDTRPQAVRDAESVAVKAAFLRNHGRQCSGGYAWTV